jgi:hypothetical protein
VRGCACGDEGCTCGDVGCACGDEGSTCGDVGVCTCRGEWRNDCDCDFGD